MDNVILTGHGMTKQFGATLALDHVDVELLEGDFTVVMGSSGSGKSTLLYALSGMDKLTAGTLCYQGRDMTNLREKDMAALRAKDFGFVFQKTHLLGNLTLYENIVLAGFMDTDESERDARERANELVSRMNLIKAKDRVPSAVSGGEAQRAAVARAVISRPRILFADEPTGALNKANTGEVLGLLTALNAEGQTVLLVTHDQEAALRGNRVLYLQDGALIDELRLEPYTGRDRGREGKLSEWLTALRW